MKRALAALVLVGALAILIKLSAKPLGRPQGGIATFTESNAKRVAPIPLDPVAALLARYPADREWVEQVVARYQHTAVGIEASDGLRGLRLLDRLDLEAVYLYERHPEEFRRLASSLGDDAAADLLVHWREYFGLKRADDVDRPRLINEIARLGTRPRRIATRFPHILPLILAEPEGICALVERLSGEPELLDDALLLLDLVSLEEGGSDLKRALHTLELHSGLALRAFRQRGPGGFALVCLYGQVLEDLGPDPPLDQALILLQVNSDYVDTLLRSRSCEFVASALRHVAAAGLIEAVGSTSHGLRLAVEFGIDGDRALRRAGGDAADVVYDNRFDAVSRRQAVHALGQFGPMAAAMLAKYASDADFLAILARDGAEIIPPIAHADVAPEVLLMLQHKPRKSFTDTFAEHVLAMSAENGQATIRLIRKDGLGRVAELNQTDVQFYQFLPLYDLLHLGGVVVGGHAPTTSEMAWAVVDGAFVVWDVLTLSAAQPQATVAGEAARTEVKAATRQAARAIGREVVEQAAESAAPTLVREGAQAAATAGTRLARWWAVRAAGGTFQVLKRAPEALGMMSVEQVARLAAPLCNKAGLRLSTWAPIRFLRQGANVVVRIPSERWVKYVALNGVQASLGVLAMHKMEEYLTSRRTAD